MFWSETLFPQVQGPEVKWLSLTISPLIVVKKRQIVEAHRKSKALIQKVLCFLQGYQVCLLGLGVFCLLVIFGARIHALHPASFVTGCSTRMEKQKQKRGKSLPYPADGSMVSCHCDLHWLINNQ